MAFPPASPKDKTQLVINPVTGKLDMVRIFNPNRIVASQFNGLGQPRVIYNPETGTYISDGATVVIDNNGDVVTT
jgi:hypothetical protein